MNGIFVPPTCAIMSLFSRRSCSHNVIYALSVLLLNNRHWETSGEQMLLLLPRLRGRSSHSRPNDCTTTRCRRISHWRNPTSTLDVPTRVELFTFYVRLDDNDGNMARQHVAEAASIRTVQSLDLKIVCAL